MTFSPNFYKSLLNRGDFAEIYLEKTDSLSLRWEAGGIDSVSQTQDSGAGLRFLQNLESRFGYVTLSNPLEVEPSASEREALLQIHHDISPGLPALKSRFASTVVEKHHTLKISFDSRTLQQKVDFLKKVFESASSGPHVRQVTMNYGEKMKTMVVFNSEGGACREVRPYIVLSVTVTVERGGDRQTAYEALGGIGGCERIESDGVAMAKIVCDRAHVKLDSAPAPVGTMPVVIAASAGGTLIHEAIGHSLEADAVLSGTSPSYLGKLGKVVAAPFLNVYDDPTVPGARGSFYFDDEGTSSEKTLLVENGVLRNYLHDRMSARRGQARPNGHGRRESYAHRPIPRMSNTYVAPGTDDPQKILSDFRNGFLVTKMGGGQVNTANGDFVFEIEEGFRVEEGKRIPVRGATLLGNGPDVLLNVEAIGSDHGWGIGTCGKEGQGVPVGDALPTMKIKSLVVGGGG